MAQLARPGLRVPPDLRALLESRVRPVRLGLLVSWGQLVPPDLRALLESRVRPVPRDFRAVRGPLGLLGLRVCRVSLVRLELRASRV